MDKFGAAPTTCGDIPHPETEVGGSPKTFARRHILDDVFCMFINTLFFMNINNIMYDRIIGIRGLK